MRARDNPFRVQRLGALSFRFPPGQGWESLLARLASLDHRGAIVGPEGHGKSTLLRELAERLTALGYDVRRARLACGERRLSAEHRAQLLAGLSPRTFLLVDSAEQLGTWAFKRLGQAASRAAGLVITTHQPGRLPTLLACTTSPELLAGLVAELAPGHAAAEGTVAAEALRRHGGDVRAALLELYEACSQ